MPYEKTDVSVAKSQEDITKRLRTFDVEAIRYTSFPAYAWVEFVQKVEGDQLLPYRIASRCGPTSGSGEKHRGCLS